jgi:hypothetical protein
MAPKVRIRSVLQFENGNAGYGAQDEGNFAGCFSLHPGLIDGRIGTTKISPPGGGSREKGSRHEIETDSTPRLPEDLGDRSHGARVAGMATLGSPGANGDPGNQDEKQLRPWPDDGG